MKFTALFVSLLGTSYAAISKPEVTIGVNIGTEPTGNFGGLEPRVKWQTSGYVQGCDLEGGIDLTVKDVDEPPTTFLWGRIKRFIPGYGEVSARGEFDANDSDNIELDVRFNGFGTALKLEGNANSKSKDVNFANAQLRKDIDTFGGILTLNPKYDFSSNKADVRVGYTFQNTFLQIDSEKRELTLALAWSDRDTITPTVDADGDFSVAYSRLLDDGKLTATWTPDDAIKLEWTDGVWETAIRAPIEGYAKATQGIKVSLKRSVGLV